jgi:hypothetical protein
MAKKMRGACAGLILVVLTTIWCVFIRCDHGFEIQGKRAALLPSSLIFNAHRRESQHDGTSTVETTWTWPIATIAQQEQWSSNAVTGLYVSSTSSTTEGQEFQDQKRSTTEVQEFQDQKSSLLRGSNITGKETSVSPIKVTLNERSTQRRKLPGYSDRLGATGTGGVILLVVIVLILLCCCRGMLCDILACVCLYEICCDDAAVGGFELM